MTFDGSSHDTAAGGNGGSSSDSLVEITAADYHRLVRSWKRRAGRWVEFPRRRKPRMIALLYILRGFKVRETYTEDEVNSAIDDRSLFAIDHVQVRRYLVDYGMLERMTDGSRYRVAHTWMSLARWDPAIAEASGSQSSNNPGA